MLTSETEAPTEGYSVCRVANPLPSGGAGVGFRDEALSKVGLHLM